MIDDYNSEENNPEFPDPIPNESTILARVVMAQYDPNEDIPKLSDEERERLADEIEMDML